MKKSTTKTPSKMVKVSEKKLKLKLVLYFLIGLLFHTLGLIVASLWIKFRSKLNKGAKFKSLLLGFTITMLISFSGNLPIVKTLTNNAIFATFPEVKPVYQTVQKAYPTYDVGYNMVYNTYYSSSGTQKTSTLTITLASSKNFPSENEYNKVGRLVCTTLNNEHKHLDFVSIHFSKEFSLLGITLYSTYYGYKEPCTYWLNKK